MTRWTLTFRPEGDGPPVELRVRRLLKLALRVCGLRCVGLREAAARQPAVGREPRQTHRDARTGAGTPRKASGAAEGRGIDGGTL